MLIELFGRNFRCFRDEFRLSMVAADIEPRSNRGIVEVPLEGQDEPLRLLRCVGIYGPNASGKSAVLWAAAALEHVIRTSASTASGDPITAYTPFLLDEVSADQPVMLGMRAVVSRREYEYEIQFDSRQFMRERLVLAAASGESVLLDRHEQSIEGDWMGDSQFALLARSYRPNTLLLPLADSVAPSLTRGLSVDFRALLLRGGEPDLSSSVGHVAKRAHQDPRGFGEWFGTLISRADFGVTRFETRVETESDDSHGVHSGIGGPDDRRFSFSFYHAGTRGHRKLPYPAESMGTRRFVMLAPIFYGLTHENTVVALYVDELGASLHPEMLAALVREFNEAPPERVRGQLIFATHDTSLFDGEAKDAVLRRDQVYFTEKDNNGAARLYSLVEFKERANHNLRKRYLEGHYGALPAVGRLGD